MAFPFESITDKILAGYLSGAFFVPLQLGGV